MFEINFIQILEVTLLDEYVSIEYILYFIYFNNVYRCLVLYRFIIMIQQVLLRLAPQARSVTCLVLRRNIAASSVVYAKAQDVHPIQKLYVDKIREYAKKSQ